MDAILSNLVQLKGVHEAFIYREGEPLLSTFNANKDESIITTAETIEHIFTALRAIDQAHDEMYFSIGSRLLISYMLENNTIIALLAEQKINFPLIHMSVKTAERKLSKLSQAKTLATETILPGIPSSLPPEPPADQSIAPNLTSTVEVSLIEQYKPALSNALIDYLGPAAPIVVNDAIKVWQKKYTQIPENVPELISLITQDLDTEKEKNAYQHLATALLSDFSAP